MSSPAIYEWTVPSPTPVVSAGTEQAYEYSMDIPPTYDKTFMHDLIHNSIPLRVGQFFKSLEGGVNLLEVNGCSTTLSVSHLKSKIHNFHFFLHPTLHLPV